MVNRYSIISFRTIFMIPKHLLQFSLLSPLVVTLYALVDLWKESESIEWKEGYKERERERTKLKEGKQKQEVIGNETFLRKEKTQTLFLGTKTDRLVNSHFLSFFLCPSKVIRWYYNGHESSSKLNREIK